MAEIAFKTEEKKEQAFTQKQLEQVQPASQKIVPVKQENVEKENQKRKISDEERKQVVACAEKYLVRQAAAYSLAQMGIFKA